MHSRATPGLAVPSISAGRQLVQHEIEAGDILEVAPIPGQKLVRVLHGLAGKPEILNSVAVLPSGGADLGGQAAEYVARDAVYSDERLASNPMQRGEAPLTDSRFLCNLSSEL
jgi:hypothetical protein